MYHFSAIAWAIIPHELGYNTEDPNEFEFNSWRIFVLVCGAPALLVAISLCWCPESPKFLLSKGREAEALKILADMYSKNTSKPKSDYPVNNQILRYRVNPDFTMVMLMHRDELTQALFSG